VVQDEPQFEPFTVEFEFDDPADAEHVLLGLIVARSNNSNSLFQDFIDALNDGLENWRRDRLLAEQKVRQSA
jgi:hypothetical protein